MGGAGSGAYGFRGSKVSKQTVEGTPFLDIQTLKNDLDGKHLTLSWNDGKQFIRVMTKTDYIILAYSVGDEEITTKISIDTTRVGYGKRLWFNCPTCCKRTARLYIIRKFFRCRACQDLTYLTCQRSGDPLNYLGLKIRRLQKKLGLDFSGSLFNQPDVHELPYFKPKHMHWETFARERERLELMILARDRAWLKACCRF